MADVTIKEKGTDDLDTAASCVIDLINNSSEDFAQIDVSPAFAVDVNDVVTYTDIQDNEIFKGLARDSNNPLLKEMIVFGFDILLKDITLRKNFENFSPEGIIEFCTDEAGFTFVSSIVSGLTIELYPAKDKKLSDIIQDMHNILGTVHRVDKDKNYYLEFPGQTLNTATLEHGVNCKLVEGWNLETVNLCTRCRLKGNTEVIQTEQFESGTGSQTEFTIDNIYASIKVEHPVGTELQPEIPDITTGDYRINRETAKVIFNTAPASGTDNIKITYQYESQITYTKTSEPILADKSNLHEKVLLRKYIKTVTEARKFVRDYLNKFSKPLISGKISVNNYDINQFNINESILVKDNTRVVNGAFVNTTVVIKRITREFGI